MFYISILKFGRPELCVDIPQITGASILVPKYMYIKYCDSLKKNR